MPFGKGWFLDTRTGEVIPVWEHATAVRENPSQYRVRQDEIEGRDREAVLKVVFGRGFIRVRFDKHRAVFEFLGNRHRAFRLIRRLLKTEEAGPLTVVKIHDLADARFRLGGYWKDLNKIVHEPRRRPRRV